jgi:hypothetical protein
MMPEPAIHENLTRGEDAVGSSDRTFGLTLALICVIVGALKLWGGHDSGWLWLAAATVSVLLALFCATALAPFNRLWLRLGPVLYKVVNPIVMALLFFATVVPTGLVMSALGKDPLRLKRDSKATSYWIVREPPGPAAETMKYQY